MKTQIKNVKFDPKNCSIFNLQGKLSQVSDIQDVNELQQIICRDCELQNILQQSIHALLNENSHGQDLETIVESDLY
jgi:hypothetical protein